MPHCGLVALSVGRLQRRAASLRRISAVWAAMILASVACCGQPVVTAEPIYLRAAGSTSMAPLVQDLAVAYHKQAPTVNLEVEGLGSLFGLEALVRGEADLAMVSWLPSAGDAKDSGPRSLEPGWSATPIARDGIAIVVHPDNPVDGLGFLQLRDVFGGHTENWQAVGGRAEQGPIRVVSREEGSGTRAAFESLVMEGSRVTPTAVVLPSSQAIADYVAEHPAAVAYLSFGYLSPRLKALRIEGEQPTVESISQGKYPLVRKLWLVVDDSPKAGVQDFVDWIISPAGQQVVGRRNARAW